MQIFRPGSLFRAKSNRFDSSNFCVPIERERRALMRQTRRHFRAKLTLVTVGAAAALATASSLRRRQRSQAAKPSRSTSPAPPAPPTASAPGSSTGSRKTAPGPTTACSPPSRPPPAAAAAPGSAAEAGSATGTPTEPASPPASTPRSARPGGSTSCPRTHATTCWSATSTEQTPPSRATPSTRARAGTAATGSASSTTWSPTCRRPASTSSTTSGTSPTTGPSGRPGTRERSTSRCGTPPSTRSAGSSRRRASSARACRTSTTPTSPSSSPRQDRRHRADVPQLALQRHPVADAATVNGDLAADGITGVKLATNEYLNTVRENAGYEAWYLAQLASVRNQLRRPRHLGRLLQRGQPRPDPRAERQRRATSPPASGGSTRTMPMSPAASPRCRTAARPTPWRPRTVAADRDRPARR